MKKIEEEFIKEFEASLCNQKSFDDIKDKINIGRFQKKKTNPAKAPFGILGMAFAFIVLAAIIVPAAIYFSLPGVTPSVGEDIFDDKNITLDILKEKGCLFYEHLVFAEDSKSHVFVTKENEITEHFTFKKVEFNEDNFDSVFGKNIIDAVEYIGLPSFEGISSELSLDYSCLDGYIRRLKLIKNDGELFVDAIEVLDKENPATWFDPDKTDLPSLDQCRQIKVGMSLDEVVRRIGKPQRDVGSGASLFRFEIDNGLYLTILLELRVDEENEYHTTHPGSTVYGTHALYVADCWIHEYTIPPVDTL